jgi:hypothetical protein
VSGLLVTVISGFVIISIGVSPPAVPALVAQAKMPRPS